MSELNQSNIETVLAELRQKLPEIAASLNQCFDLSCRLELGEAVPVAACEQTVGNEPGVIVSLNVGTSVMLCAIAGSLPLPEWYAAPNVGQKVRLDTLALEWSLNCVPDDLAPTKQVTHGVPRLAEAIQYCRPTEEGVCQPVLVTSGDASPSPKIWFVWPVALEPADAAQPEPVAADPAVAPPLTAASDPVVVRRAGSRVHTGRLLNLPVKVIVKLAEKKVELGQLSGLGPGAIVTFEKSCEALLDLYVNNQLYCRGEAVKIGEKFGIKITEVGSVEQRVSAVLQSPGR